MSASANDTDLGSNFPTEPTLGKQIGQGLKRQPHNSGETALKRFHQFSAISLQGLCPRLVKRLPCGQVPLHELLRDLDKGDRSRVNGMGLMFSSHHRDGGVHAMGSA